jgi:predicted O-methyltransferase YrrM
MLYTFKIFIREKIDQLLDSYHFGASLDRLRVLEENTFKKEGELFTVPFNYHGLGHYDSISPSQVVAEIRSLFDVVRELKPKIVCEIGTDKGGTLYLWCQASESDALILSLDLPSRKRYSERRRRLYAQFKKSKSQTLDFLAGDSHSASSEDLVSEKLGDRKIDFLFIDGDHTYEGVKQDFLTYSKLVRSGGIIAFHDIRTVRPGCGVKEFWDELSSSIPSENRKEFALQAFGPTGAGIGIIIMS